MITTALKQLKQERSLLQQQLNQLNIAINALEGIGGKSPAAVATPGKRRHMSAAARRAISAAQKARWAKVRAGKAVTAEPMQATKRRKKMSKLGKLKLHLGSLNRYGKKEEAKKVQAQIAALQAKAEKK